MLPFIDLRLADFCRVAFNYCLGLYMPVGRSLWFDRGKAAQAGKGTGLNFDEYLTVLLASLFVKERVKPNLLILYAAIPGRFALSFCSSESLNFLKAATPGEVMPGCIDLRQDFIPQTAAPFVLYDGSTLHRLHPMPQPDRTAFYVWDFDDCLGNVLKEVDKGFYFRVLNDKDTYFAYAAVPKNPRTIIKYPGGAVTVEHAFCRAT